MYYNATMLSIEVLGIILIYTYSTFILYTITYYLVWYTIYYIYYLVNMLIIQ